jgi:amino acid transporter/nucleotide-binding universal stress UspA family protein
MVGLGAIVGGGIFVLAGVAFEAAGPGAIFAFALNGVIAIITALSFAEMSTSFPESGGAYTFAKKVLDVRAAFAMGWVLWFAYIVAGVLYALGFAEFAVVIATDLLRLAGSDAPAWLSARHGVVLVAMVAVGAYALQHARKVGSGGDWATIGKIVVFVGLCAAGAWSLSSAPAGTVEESTTPWLPMGFPGLLSAMGFTFIALQGFDLIAAIGGEVKQPRRVIPRAMLLSLGAALVIYIPLLLFTMTVGRTEGQTISEMAAADPETLMAVAVENFLGPVGYWLVMVAAVLSTLSALSANVLAASRVALSMARDRTLPGPFATMSRRGTPALAVYASALALVAIMLMVPDVAAAGAAASLIFLLSFALVHVTAYLARRRMGTEIESYKTPWFPLVPVVGGVACAALAVFQAVAVPSAGQITALWLALGAMLYYALFASRARAVDAYSEAVNPDLTQLRGRTPLVLVPVSNPATAPALLRLAAALAPRDRARIRVLRVLRREETAGARMSNPFIVGQEVSGALTASFELGHEPETLITVADEPWAEIARVAEEYRCDSLLLGLSRLDDGKGEKRLEDLLNKLKRDVTVVRADESFHPKNAGRILVPIGGKGTHDTLRARMLGSLCRTAEREIVFLRVVPSDTSDAECERARRALQRFGEEETPPGVATAEVIRSDDVVESIVERAAATDLLVLGLMRHRGKRLFGEVALRIATRTTVPTVMLSDQSGLHIDFAQSPNKILADLGFN